MVQLNTPKLKLTKFKKKFFNYFFLQKFFVYTQHEKNICEKQGLFFK